MNGTAEMESEKMKGKTPTNEQKNIRMRVNDMCSHVMKAVKAETDTKVAVMKKAEWVLLLNLLNAMNAFWAGFGNTTRFPTVKDGSVRVANNITDTMKAVKGMTMDAKAKAAYDRKVATLRAKAAAAQKELDDIMNDIDMGDIL